MNEELRIIIKAISDEAQKNLAEVRKELDKIENEGKTAGKGVDDAMKGIAKGVAIALGAVAALTTALVALGKKSMEFQKQQAKLVAGFQAMGASAEQANETYLGLYRFLGDSDRATETAQNLARITTNTQDLTEWTQILQGVYARAGNAIPVETLSEAANETIQVGKVTGTLADALNWVGVSEDAFNAKLATTTSLEEREALIRSTLNSLYGNAAKIYERNNQALIRYQEAQYRLDAALAEATKYVVPLMTELNNLAATLLQVLKPAFETISAVVIVFVQWIVAAVQYIGAFFGLFSEEGTSAIDSVSQSISQVQQNTSGLVSGTQGYGDALGDAAAQAKELKKQVMGFDELNVINPIETSSGSSGGGVGGIGGGISSLPSLDSMDFDIPALSDFMDKLDETKAKIEGILVLVGLVGAAFLAWKLTPIIQDLILINTSFKELKKMGKISEAFEAQDRIDALKFKIKEITGKALILAGALALVYGYSDAWANGVDWGNLATMLVGMTAIVAGLALAYGSLAAAIGLAVAGVALMIVGVKDFINNGPTLQNTILIIGGAIATAVALATAGISVLISAIVAAVAAIAAFITAIALEKPAIMEVEEAQEALTDAKNKAAEAENSYISAIDNAEASLKRLTDAEKKYGISGAELYAQVQAGTLDYANMTAAQKEVYKAYLDNEEKQKTLKTATEELTKAKQAEKLASFENQLALAKESGSYDEFKQSVIDAFEKGELSAEQARDMIAKSMSEMSDDAQQTFMQDLPGSIKDGLNPNKYETTWKKIKDGFSNLWEGIKNIFSKVGSFFSGVWDTIKRTFTNVASTVANTITSTVKKAINGVLSTSTKIINGFISAINFAIDVINAIPGVNISKLDKLSVPKLARGGIVDSATLAVVGERGKEAVLPLENNTGWMDALAARIAERNNTPSRIVLMLDKQELGYATIGSINDITRQSGKLQLEFV